MAYDPLLRELTRSLTRAQILALISGGGPPTGPAGGDLAGTYPNPTVAKIAGAPLGATTPAAGRLLVGSGTAWVSSILSGDASLAAGGALTLATVNANVGTFGSATQVAQVTVNAKGLVTAASNVTIAAAGAANFVRPLLLMGA